MNIQQRDSHHTNRTYLPDVELEDRLEAFVIELEGKDPDDIDNELLDAFHSFSLEQGETQTFFTACGQMNIASASKATLQLSEESTKHTLTKETSQFELEDDANTYNIKDRYSAAKFHGILIDMGAAGHSTVGHGQYIAYTAIFQSYPINTLERIEIKFGISLITSIGSIRILTRIGPCIFHIVEENTPFLLSLKDLDEKQALFDNLRMSFVSQTV
ncbi:hypothetical protein BGT96224_A20369 [Blumeria graminis f. sp. tritici 96224]|uniref:Uncharacterized protein n=1 Tax=Blumeria graminis f. sp. tritici 96224 TaxID=1268274 RepID=A0A656KHU9_BLUGR|nr:hypothetical protein BGT96224_A20369 [Blumeria graminis f. sp. tritici 96224]